MTPDLKTEFKKFFSSEPQYMFFCPGRVNLIGEHIDYNGGQVMPCAISLGTYVAMSLNQEPVFRFRCLNFKETADVPLQPGYSKTGSEWFNYPLGVIHHFLQEGHSIKGIDMLFYGNLPIAAGLSSSASIEVLTGFALQTIFSIPISRIALALLARKVENEFIGVNCGIMDQFAVAMGSADKAILLNCDTLAYEYLPFDTDGYTLAIINSNKQRTLADSKYNERFAECRSALRLLQQEAPARHLCDIDPATFQRVRKLIADATLARRAEHVITENARVMEARGALSRGDITRFGQLMYASHRSLKELYEVSGKELDTIVEFAGSFDGCIGARMTGAGFGGCAIALVRQDRFDEFALQLASHYERLIGYAPGVFASAIGDGVRRI